MGVYTAPVCHLLCPAPLNPNSEPQIPNPPRRNPKTVHPVDVSRAPVVIQRRHLLLFSVPISLSSSIPLNSSSALDFLSPAERDASEAVSRRVAEAVELLERGRDLQAQGDFIQALDYFSQVPVPVPPWALFGFLGSNFVCIFKIQDSKRHYCLIICCHIVIRTLLGTKSETW